MSNNIESHLTSVPASNDPAQHPFAFSAAFNSADSDLIEAVYERTGVLVSRPGVAVTGAERREANDRLASLGLPITVEPRHVYVAGDIALLIVDWSIGGVGPDGSVVDIHGTATDVARQAPDGSWKYVIDNPFGTAEYSTHH